MASSTCWSTSITSAEEIDDAVDLNDADIDAKVILFTTVTTPPPFNINRYRYRHPGTEKECPVTENFLGIFMVLVQSVNKSICPPICGK